MQLETRVCKEWNKFRQLVPLLTSKDVSSLLMRGKSLYVKCGKVSVRNVCSSITPSQ